MICIRMNTKGNAVITVINALNSVVVRGSSRQTDNTGSAASLTGDEAGTPTKYNERETFKLAYRSLVHNEANNTRIVR